MPDHRYIALQLVIAQEVQEKREGERLEMIVDNQNLVIILYT